MKKLLIVIAILLFLPSLVLARDSVKIRAGMSTAVVGTVCLDGFLFAYMFSYGGDALELRQVYKAVGAKTFPVECNTK